MTRRALLQTAGAALQKRPGPALDSDGMLRIEGRRAFLLGSYQLPNRPNPWKQARDAGLRVVHLPASKEQLDRAREHGIYGWLSLGSIRNPADQDRIRKAVSGFQNHPALLFWETEDEPSYQWKKAGPRVPPEAIRETYRFVKSLDPLHPLYLNHAPTNLVSTLQQYNPGGDLIATDVYPVIPPGIREQYALWPDGQQGDLLNSTISQVGQYTGKMRQVAGPSRGLLIVLQAFAWENLREKDRDPKMVLYPTRAQIRFMAYQAIVHGATGLLFWGLQSTPPEAPLWDDLASVTRELRGLDAELAAPPVNLPLRLEYHDTGHSLDRGIEWIAKPGPVLIAVNAEKNPVEVTFNGLTGRRATVLTESRALPLANASLRDSFGPFGVHVYRFEAA
ncbi:MAG: hypothetical protein HYR60_07150 [Acidobacteria bacterium]|nr:hypothetical protein [Acidobacteriota bacterium]